MNYSEQADNGFLKIQILTGGALFFFFLLSNIGGFVSRQYFYYISIQTGLKFKREICFYL